MGSILIFTSPLDRPLNKFPHPSFILVISCSAYYCELWIHRAADPLCCFDGQLCVGGWFLEMDPKLVGWLAAQVSLWMLIHILYCSDPCRGQVYNGQWTEAWLLCITTMRLINKCQATFHSLAFHIFLYSWLRGQHRMSAQSKREGKK